MQHPTTLALPLAAAPLQRGFDALRGVMAAWRLRRRARLTYLALSELDPRTLRDLGFSRSELASVAHDVASPHRSDRVRWLSGPRF